MSENLTIGFIGNPNCGKTTLFNAYTGANLKVANWPGVTVEKVEGAIKDHDLNIRLVDLPGTYSLTSYTMEEQVSRQFILSDEVDVIIDVADASALERNLYLTLQLLELGKPVVLALNMMDIVEKRGMEIDTHRLPELLGIPVIPVSARKRTGLDVLLHAAAHHKDCKDPECLIHHHKYISKHRHNHHAEYVMEGIMSKLGLSGRAFIPMILGFGCTVPAIMASRTLENKHDRFKVMLITPFMSCSARLPIYILFAEMFFKERAMIVAYSMYLIGLVVAILVAAVIHLIDKRKSENYLLIELPEYKIPSSRTVAIYVWEKVKDYLTKAGTTIFVASIAMWILLNFGPHGYTTEMVDSFGAVLGHWLVPFFEPIGLGYWQIAVALIAGISAKEVVVSSCAVLFGIPNITSEAGMNTLVGILGTAGFGQLNAFCLMIFCLLYIPCAAAMATIKREARSWKWMCFSAVFQLAVAWGMTFIIYHIGRIV